jgi:glycosyltransferase involved in cell wall biosynthesis
MTEISVVLPTHNRADWLLLALRSVLWQRDVQLELIVVDDGSTDDTSRVVAGLRQRVRLVKRDDPGGVSIARNDGAAQATGEWLAFLDDDDLWAPEKLVRQFAAVRRTGRAWGYTGWVVINDSLEVIAGEPPPPPSRVAELMCRRNVLPTASSVMVRRDVFEKAGGFDAELTNGEDWELWIRLTNYGPPAWLPEPLVGYRLHPGNASLDTEALRAGMVLIEQRHGTKVDRGSIERWIAESQLRTGHRAKALKSLALAAIHGNVSGMASELMAALVRRVDRVLDRPPRMFPPTADAIWIAEAQRWLDEFAALPTLPLL